MRAGSRLPGGVQCSLVGLRNRVTTKRTQDGPFPRICWVRGMDRCNSCMARLSRRCLDPPTAGAVKMGHLVVTPRETRFNYTEEFFTLSPDEASSARSLSRSSTTGRQRPLAPRTRCGAQGHLPITAPRH